MLKIDSFVTPYIVLITIGGAITLLHQVNKVSTDIASIFSA